LGVFPLEKTETSRVGGSSNVAGLAGASVIVFFPHSQCDFFE
jgi:hypothetical protein